MRQEQQLHDRITHFEGLIQKARAAEETESDPSELRRYIQVRLNLERELSDAKATLLRTTKLIQKEKAWLATYDEEEAMGIEAQADADLDAAAYAEYLEEDDAAADTSAERPEEQVPLSETGELILDAVEKVKAGALDDISIGQVELLLKAYASLTEQDDLWPDEVDRLAALAGVMEALDTRLAELRDLWARLSGDGADGS